MGIVAVTSIGFILIVTILSIGLWLILKTSYSQAAWSKKGTIVLKFDPLTRNVTPYKFEGLYNTHSKIAQLMNSKARAHTAHILRLWGMFLNNPQSGKLFRGAIHQIGNGQETINYVFLAKDMKVGANLSNLSFKVLIQKVVDVSDYLIVVEWNTPPPPSYESHQYLTPIEDVVNNVHVFKGFITFDLNFEIPNVRSKFIQELQAIKKLHKYDVFVWLGLTIVVCYASTYKKIKKKTNRLIKFVENKKIKIGFGSFIRGSGSARFQGISSRKELNKALATLDFITNLSLRWNEPFVDLRTAQNFQQEFISYNNQAKKFRDLIRSHKFEFKFLPVKSRKSQRKIVDFCVPDLSGFEKQELKSLLKSAYNHKQLINANVEKIINSETIEHSILVDVNSSWLLDNYQHLKLKKICYILNIDNYGQIDQIANLTSELVKQGFLIGLRIEEFSQFAITIIHKLKPALLVVDKKIVGEETFIDTTHYTKMLALKNIFEAIDIKVIFENLTPKINNQLATKLGINFYFNSKI